MGNRFSEGINMRKVVFGEGEWGRSVYNVWGEESLILGSLVRVIVEW